MDLLFRATYDEDRAGEERALIAQAQADQEKEDELAESEGRSAEKVEIPRARHQDLGELLRMASDPSFRGHVAMLTMGLRFVGDGIFEVESLARTGGSNGPNGHPPLCRFQIVEDPNQPDE